MALRVDDRLPKDARHQVVLASRGQLTAGQVEQAVASGQLTLEQVGGRLDAGDGLPLRWCCKLGLWRSEAGTLTEVLAAGVCRYHGLPGPLRETGNLLVTVPS